MQNKEIEIINFDNRIDNKVKEIAKGDPTRNIKSCKIEDIELILRFKKDIEADGISKARVIKYLTTLQRISNRLDRPFSKCGKEDIKEFVRWLEQSEYAEWSKHDMKAVLKRFFKWLSGKEDEYPDSVKWVRSTMKNNKKKIPEELLTRKEINQMINSTYNIRNKAIIESLYFSACRIGELLSRRIRHVQVGKPFTKLIVAGKTGMRTIQLTQDVYLRSWINQHPRKHDIDSPLCVSLDNPEKNRPISFTKINSMLKDTAKKAGINKAVYPYLFRHSRLTELAQHMTESQLKIFAGWTAGSKSAATYVHLSQKDLVDSLKRSEGKKVEYKEEEKPKVDTLLCIACGEVNPKDLKLCSKCGEVIDEKYRVQITEKEKAMQTLVEKLLEDRVVSNRLKEIIEKIGEKS